jgi:hypothetical protein
MNAERVAIDNNFVWLPGIAAGPCGSARTSGCFSIFPGKTPSIKRPVAPPPLHPVRTPPPPRPPCHRSAWVPARSSPCIYWFVTMEDGLFFSYLLSL